MEGEPVTYETSSSIVVHGAPQAFEAPLSLRLDKYIRDHILALPIDMDDDDVREAPQIEVLPLLRQGGVSYGVTPQGDVVSFPGVAPYDAPQEVDGWRRAWVLSLSRERYPELESLIPPPPLSCRVCARCGGDGQIGIPGATVTCVCGGLGWMPPISDESTDAGTTE